MTTEDTYLKVVRGKTAALFSAATEAGSLVAGAPEQDVLAFRDYGDALGIAFQIVDDFLDYGGTSGALGKNVGDDLRERKVTLPVIYAVADADDTERAFWKRVIEDGRQEEEDLDRALQIFTKHRALERTRDTALAWAGKAGAELEKLPDGEIRGLLSDLNAFVVSRAT